MKTMILVLFSLSGMVAFAQKKVPAEPITSSTSVISETDDHLKSQCQSHIRNGESFSSFSCDADRKDGFFEASVQKGMLVFKCDALPEQGSITLAPVLANNALTTARLSFQSNRTDRCLTVAFRVVPGRYQYQIETDGYLQAPRILQVNAAEEKQITIHSSF